MAKINSMYIAIENNINLKALDIAACPLLILGKLEYRVSQTGWSNFGRFSIH
jgi:hypothetical protein